MLANHSGEGPQPSGLLAWARFTSPRHDDEWAEYWLDLPDQTRGGLLPGFGWVLGLGDGRCDVGLSLQGDAGLDQADAVALLDRWLASLPHEWGFSAENRLGATRCEPAAVPRPYPVDALGRSLQSARAAADVAAQSAAELSHTDAQPAAAHDARAVSAVLLGNPIIRRLALRYVLPRRRGARLLARLS